MRWRSSPGALEFFEKGMACMDKFSPWYRLKVRQRECNRDRLSIVVTTEHPNEGKSSMMVWVDEPTKLKLLSRSGESKVAPSPMK
jgi:hypothetical protein